MDDLIHCANKHERGYEPFRDTRIINHLAEKVRSCRYDGNKNFRAFAVVCREVRKTPKRQPS